MIKKKHYTSEERTEAQFKSMDLKRNGYNVDRIIVVDKTTETKETIAFGYYPSFSPEVKVAKEVDAKVANEEKYEFIYWN